MLPMHRVFSVYSLLGFYKCSPRLPEGVVSPNMWNRMGGAWWAHIRTYQLFTLHFIIT